MPEAITMDPVQIMLADMRSLPKPAGRKTAAQNLVTYLNDDTDNICEKLDFNSVTNDKKGCEKMTWTKLFIEVRDYFRKETEKVSPQMSAQNKLSLLGVVKLVFTKATRNPDRPWLQWNKIFDFITVHIQVERQVAVFGPVLINLLESFLAIELYKSLIDAPSWIELINILIRCYGKHSISTSSLLGCLKVCIEQGSLYDHVITTLRSVVVDFYVKILHHDRTILGENVSIYLQGVTSLSKQNGNEFRGILCKLGETVIPYILQMQSFTEDQETALVEFLLVQYRIHMPYDVEMTSEGFYADDAAKWKEILRLKYSYCIDTIEEIAAKRSSHKKHNIRARENLLMLTAKCTKQISSSSLLESGSSDEEDVDGSNHSKKKMRYKSFHTIISDVYSKPASEGLMTWLNYLTVVLNNFPELVGTRLNYSNLIYLGSSLFNTSYMLRREFHRYFLSLIRAEKCLRSSGKINDVTDTWTVVWDLTIKSVSVCEDKEGAIELLRRILKDVHPPNVTSLLMLYVGGSMPLLKCSVQLLKEYLSLCSLPIQINGSSVSGSQSDSVDEEFAATPCPRLELLKWLMKVVNQDISGFEPLIATVMCSLVVKQSHVLLHEDFQCSHVAENYPMKFEKLLVKSCFVQIEAEVNIDDPKPSCTPTDLTNYNFIVERRPAERLALAIQSDFDSIPIPRLSLAGSDIPYKKFVTKLNFYLNILNVIETNSIGESSSTGQIGFKSTLERICDNGLTNCNTYITDIFSLNQTTKRAESIEKIMRFTRILFSTDTLCDKVRVFVSKRFAQPTVELVKRFFRSNLARYIERQLNDSHESGLLIMDPDLPTKVHMMQHPNAAELVLLTRTERNYEMMSMEALNFLIEYGLLCRTLEYKLHFFEELLKDLGKESYTTSNQFLFDAVATLISKLATTMLNDRELHKLVTEDFGIISLLQKCCRCFYQLPPCAERLWILFKEVIPIIAQIDGRGRQNFMILVGTLYQFLRNVKKLPRFIYEKAFAALMELSKFDPNLSWTHFQPIQAPIVWVLEDIHEFLSANSHQVRMMAADTICRIYENASPYDYSEGITSSQADLPTDGQDSGYQEKRKTFLDTMFQKLLSSFEVENDLSSDEKKEESINRTSLVLSSFTRLIFAFPYTQKQTIMFLFTMIKLKNIDVSLAQRALQFVSSSSTKTMCCYLPYVLRKMLKLKNSIEDLPYQLFGFENFNTYAAKFRNEVCVEYFEQDKMNELETFATRFNTSSQCLIQECYGLIMAKITPDLTIHNYALKHKGYNLAKTNDVHRRLTEVLGGKDVTNTLMATCLGDVVLNLISLTFDPLVMDQWNCPEVKLSEPVPPHYPQFVVEKCLQFLKDASRHTGLSVIGYMASTSHQSVYKILLSLVVRIHEAHDELQKFWRLHQFKFFVDLLLHEPPEIFVLMKEYVCSFVFNAYLRLLTQDCNGMDDGFILRFLKVILRLIHELVARLTSGYAAEMKIFYVPVIRSIVSVSLKHMQLMDSAKTSLDFLLKTHGDTFASCIELLDPFPSYIVEFEEYHLIHNGRKYGNNRRVEWSLSKEFERLLNDNGNDVTKGCCTKESLQFLRELLSKRKRDLERMLKNLESKRFSEECVDDPAHSIVQMLISITLDTTQPQDVVLEACKCLGEIGPVDLSILVLPPYKNQGKISSMDGALSEIIKIIAGYQTSNDIQVVNVSGKVLRSICQFEQCSLILNVDLKDTRLAKVMLPFCSKQTELNKSNEQLDANSLETKLGLNEMCEGIEYKTWLKQLTTGIIECFRSRASLVAHFLPLCELRADFCEDIFPYVIYLCLFEGKTNPLVKKTLTGYFRTFFSKFVSNYNSATETARSFTPSSSGTTSTIIYMNKLALRLLIRVVQFLRRHPLPEKIKGNLKLTPWDNNFWLDINYLDVARAAQYCGAYLTSILYVEIAATQMDMSLTGTQSQYSDSYTDDSSQDESISQGGSMYPRNKSEASKIQKLLLKAYSSIGEVDAVYGCGSARFADVQSSMHHLEQSMDWHRLLMLANGSSVTNDGQDNLQTCSEHHTALALKQLGLHNVLWIFLKGLERNGNSLSEDLKQAQYECGWRLSKWDLKNDKPAYIKDITESSGLQLGFQRCIYDGICSGLSDDNYTQDKAVNNGFRSVYTELRHATLESSENIYGFLSQFQMLRVVEDFFDKENSYEVIQHLVRKWKLHDRMPIGDFKYHEPVLYLRNVLLRAYDQKHARVNLEQEINESLLELIAKSRVAGRLDLAESCAMDCLGSKTSSTSLDFEVAKNHWARGKRDIARDILSKLIKKSSSDDDLFPAFLLECGEWLSISHCERPAVILKDYLQRSCNIYEKRQNVSQSNLSKAYIILAKYADVQYQNVTKYIASDVFKSKMAHLTRAQEDEQRLQNSVDVDSKKSAQISRRHSVIDKTEISYIHKEQRNFLELALTHYLKGLKTSNENDLLIFRAISLWLEDGNEMDVSDVTLVEKTTRIFNEEALPSYKYIVVLHQLSGRLGSTSPGRNEVLRDILIKCAKQHPYHTLPIIITQASLHKDDENLPKKNSSLKVQLADRVKAAAEIVSTLRGTAEWKQLVNTMEALWLALIRLANIKEVSKNADGIKKGISPDVMKCLTKLEMVPVPTSGIPVLSTANYKDCIIGISEFENTYGLVGGINSPKKLVCRGTNGVKYNMLLKGFDDLRQDAVMQQVFGVMNNLLQVEPKTKLRRLLIRTYKVIPLSQRTGLIEWVEDTQTLGEYLVGTTAEPAAGAHVRYRPNDYNPMTCRRLLTDAKPTPGDLEKKYSTYVRICEHFKPVFRHFFFENFKEAGVFFEKRLAYTRSVATTSIVGYILGLGDRHVLNILIDKKTAEFIHIDLGIAFEQGRILPTPETVPFRLTRDVIDGMGISGVDGVFKKSCEETMDVLRNNAEVIITVLQVLLYDPLHMWALTNDRVAKVQPSDTSKVGRKSKVSVEPQEDSVKERNNSAARVLLRLRQKLMGIEEEGGAVGALSSGSSLSVDGHVSLLIQRAVDPDKLCRLFPGWQPYL